MRTLRQSGRGHSLLLPATLIAAFCISPNAVATIVTVDFSFFQTTAYAGLPAGAQVSGSFSFDDSEYQQYLTTGPIDVFHFENGLPTLSLEMDWLGTHWTTSNASLALLTLGADGSLLGWFLGGSYANPEICGDARYHCGNFFPSTEPDFEMYATTGITATGAIPNDAGEVTSATGGTWSVRSEVSVPEPGTMALFGLGFAGLAIAGRRRTNPR